LTFNGLASGTTYYIFARSQANTNYLSGTQSAALTVMTHSESNITIIFDPVADPADALQMPPGNLVINLTLNNTISLSLPGFTNYEWLVNNVLKGTSSTFDLRASDFGRTDVGKNTLTIEAFRNSIPYGLSIEFTVVE